MDFYPPVTDLDCRPDRDLAVACLNCPDLPWRDLRPGRSGIFASVLARDAGYLIAVAVGAFPPLILSWWRAYGSFAFALRHLPLAAMGHVDLKFASEPARIAALQFAATGTLEWLVLCAAGLSALVSVGSILRWCGRDRAGGRRVRLRAG